MPGSLSAHEIKVKQLEAQIAFYRILLRRSHNRFFTLLRRFNRQVAPKTKSAVR